MQAITIPATPADSSDQEVTAPSKGVPGTNTSVVAQADTTISSTSAITNPCGLLDVTLRPISIMRNASETSIEVEDGYVLCR
jgi:hypothetical protein